MEGALSGGKVCAEMVLKVRIQSWLRKTDFHNRLTADVVQVPIHTELGTDSGSPLIPRLPNLCSAA